MKIVSDSIKHDELKQMAADSFGDLVKAVVDIDRELVAIDAELHSDLEALLLQDGSKQINLWGINLYPEIQGDGFIEFDSLINVRPSQGNRGRGIENENIRRQIIGIIANKIKK